MANTRHGYHLSVETRQRQSLARRRDIAAGKGSKLLKGRKQDPEFAARRLAASQASRRANPKPHQPMDKNSSHYKHMEPLFFKPGNTLFAGRKHTEEWKHAMSEQSKANWQNPEMASRMMRQYKPTKPEISLGGILNEICPGQYRYVGDGNFSIGTLIPDFVNVNGQKKVVELFGDYWHSPKMTATDPRQTEEGRKKIMAEFGYSCLVIWEHELKNPAEVAVKVKEFNEQ